ncbi:MAG: PDZ domain-containing protein [Gemmatimonadaceae bacterium]|nr:PDZ domain-containing protein [Gemmatimonadaceae bacterium]
MRTRFLSPVLLALVGASSTLAAQSKSTRPTPERDEPRTMARTLMSRVSGDPDRPRLGISIESTGARDTLGVLVAEVTEGGPAEKAGIRKGDRLAAINGVNLRLSAVDAEDEELQGITQRRLTRELSKHAAGDDVELRVVRDGKPLTLKVKTVAARELEPRAITVADMRRADPDRASLGIGLGGSGSKRDTLGILVSSLANDGPAEQAGIEEGDRIAAINGVDLRVAREDVGDWAATSARMRRLTREMEKLKAGDEVELRVYRSGQPRMVKVKTAAARDLERSAQRRFIIGDGAGWDGFSFTVPPVPPMPPLSPLSPHALMAPDVPDRPDAPVAPRAPRFYRFEGDGKGAIHLRSSPRIRAEVR